MLPALVITGFLGSGKTTLLVNSAREHFSGKRVAVIVNELGQVGVDGKVLKNAYSQVLELPEGCICCSLSAEFEKAVREIMEKYHPEVLLVETSGGAEPFPIILSLQALDCPVEGVICLVDCAHFDRYREDSVAKYQIGGSNIIVLNKTDLAKVEEVDRIEKDVLETWKLYRPVNTLTGEPLYTKVKVYRTSYGRLPKEVFEGIYTLPELKALPQHPQHAHWQKVINIFEPLDYEDLEKRLKNLPENVIRAKGIVRLKRYPYPVVVNYAFGRVDTPIEIKDYDGPYFVVLIGN
ncbi:MAG: GTP-binding protein [Aquificaceae bacterium]|nr:GTP-binding protein [Aquificaceae bacterium]MDW8097317.1 GTP-binding protein [Aquificaceae bacterium]